MAAYSNQRVAAIIIKILYRKLTVIIRNSVMKTRSEYLELLTKHIAELKEQFGVRSFRIFGSVARNEHTEDSDVDVCVEMEPDLYLLVGLKQFLEKLLGCSVDVVRMHRNMN
jgi:predicted nucleotidyltransferase